MKEANFDPLLWHRAKARAGSRKSRKTGWKSGAPGKHPRRLIREIYDQMLKERTRMRA